MLFTAFCFFQIFGIFIIEKRIQHKSFISFMLRINVISGIWTSKASLTILGAKSFYSVVTRALSHEGGISLALGVLGGWYLQASSLHREIFEASEVCIPNGVWRLQIKFSEASVHRANFAGVSRPSFSRNSIDQVFLCIDII